MKREKSKYNVKLNKRGITINISNKLLFSLMSLNKPDLELVFNIPINKTDKYIVECNIKKLTYFTGD